MLKHLLIVALVMVMGISTVAAQAQSQTPNCDPYQAVQNNFVVQPSDLTAPATNAVGAMVMQDLGGFNPQVIMNVTASIQEVPRNIAPNANPATHLVLDDYGVVTAAGNELQVHEGTCTESAILGELAQGTRVAVLDGPLAGEGFAWWRVRISGLTGWVMEGEDSQIWLRGA